MTSMGEHDPAVEAPHECEVLGLSPETRREGNRATAVWGQAQYRCPHNGRLTVRLMRMQYFVGSIQVSQKEYDAPASSSWSEVFRTGEADCASHGPGARYHSEARHAHSDGSDSSDGSDTIRACT